jgi:ATP phosphoribosyltransferase regulatory subunit
MMPQLYGTFEVIDQLKSEVVSPLALSALDNLNDILLILQDAGLLDYISIDLGMLQSLDYYSGTIFKGFTYGLGFPLFSGGRYDQITEAFGRRLSSTGFSIGLNFVLTALRRQQIPPEPAQAVVMVGYLPKARAAAFDYVRLLRAAGNHVIMDCQRCNAEELAEQAKRHGAASIHHVLSDSDVRILQGGNK